MRYIYRLLNSLSLGDPQKCFSRLRHWMYLYVCLHFYLFLNTIKGGSRSKRTDFMWHISRERGNFSLIHSIMTRFFFANIKFSFLFVNRFFFFLWQIGLFLFLAHEGREWCSSVETCEKKRERERRNEVRDFWHSFLLTHSQQSHYRIFLPVST